MLVLIMGQIDISTGTLIGVVGFVCGRLVVEEVPIFVILIVAMLIGALNSAIIALINQKFRVPTFIVSLALSKVYSGMFPLLPDAGWVSTMPNYAKEWFNSTLFGRTVPLILVLAIVVFIFFAFFMSNTSFGRQMYAVGGHADSARLAGINVFKVTLITYMMSGACIGICGIFYWLPQSLIVASGTQGTEMYYLAIAVIGGIAISGGSGKPIGVLFGALFFALLQRAAILLGLSYAFLYFSYGFLILFFLIVSDIDVKERKAAKLVHAEANKVGGQG